jgi:hypothetical protein
LVERKGSLPMISSVAAFIGVSLVVIMTAGPDTAITIRNTAHKARWSTFPAAARAVLYLTKASLPCRSSKPMTGPQSLPAALFGGLAD